MEAEEAGEAVELEAAEDMDLMAAFDEADMPEAEEAVEEEDKARKMAELIKETIAANQGRGIGGALDATFEALAANAMELSNPETGVIEVSGDEIVGMTLNAMNGRFDASQDQMRGALSAATLRAAENGCIDALGGDATLCAMAAVAGNALYGLQISEDDVMKLAETALVGATFAFQGQTNVTLGNPLHLRRRLRQSL